MENDRPTFDQLPMAVAELNMKMDSLIQRFDETFGKGGQSTNEKTGEHELLDLSAAAKLLGKPESTIYTMTSSRFIPFHKRGNKLYFFKDELTAWVEGGGQSGIGNEQNFNQHLAELRAKKRHKAASP